MSKTLKLKIGNQFIKDKKHTKKLSDKEIEDYIWENISIPLSQVDIDNNSDAYVQYLNAVYWAKWGRDNDSL